MKVLVGEKMYQMNREEFDNLLKVASDLVPCGIYAIERPGTGYCELRNDKCTSRSELKRRIRQLKAAGIKVYSNG